VFTGCRGDGAAQAAGWITLGPAGGYGITEYLASVLLGPVRCLKCALGLNSSECRQQFRRCDGLDRSVSQPWKNIQFKTPDDFVAMAGSPGRCKLGVPIAGDDLEGLSLLDACRLLRFFGVSRINTIGYQGTCLVTFLSGIGKRYLGVSVSGAGADIPTYTPKPLGFY